jgi:macrolide-specific efflux system membrane fusion protein
MAMKKLPKTLFKFIIFAAVVGAALWFWQPWNKKPGPADTAAPPLTVTRGDIEDVVTAQGKLEPKDYVDVGAQVSGQLQVLHTEIGDDVKSGTLVAEIDPEIYEAQVKADDAAIKTLSAQLQQQKAQRDLAAQQYQRNANLVKTAAVSKDAYDISKTALDVAKAAVAATEAQMEEAQSRLEGDTANLGYTKIYAPMDGTVVVQDTKEGQTLNANQTAPTIMQIANLDTMTVRAQVAEADIMRIKEGVKAYFTTLGSDERRWEGTVRQVLPSPETINDVVLFNVLIDVDNKDRTLMTGMSTQVFFTLGEAKDVVLVPNAALGKRLMDQDKDGAMAYEVIVVENGIETKRPALIGLTDRTLAEVKSGLNAGEQVVDQAAALAAKRAGGGFNPARMGRRL